MVDAENAAGAEGTAPAPLTCGVKKRAATLEKTMKARKSMEVRDFYATGKSRNFRPVPSDGEGDRGRAENAEVISIVGVFPDVLAGKTRYLPKACSSPAWNSLRQPGVNGVGFIAAQPRSGFSTALSQPMLESTRFSLKGVSSTRA